MQAAGTMGCIAVETPLAPAAAHHRQVRMQAEAKLPPGVPRRYPSALQAYLIIARQGSRCCVCCWALKQLQPRRSFCYSLWCTLSKLAVLLLWFAPARHEPSSWPVYIGGGWLCRLPRVHTTPHTSACATPCPQAGGRVGAVDGSGAQHCSQRGGQHQRPGQLRPDQGDAHQNGCAAHHAVNCDAASRVTSGVADCLQAGTALPLASGLPRAACVCPDCPPLSNPPACLPPLPAGLFGDTLACHLASSVCAGFLSTVCGSPFDVVKSRMMSALPALHC